METQVVGAPKPASSTPPVEEHKPFDVEQGPEKKSPQIAKTIKKIVIGAVLVIVVMGIYKYVMIRIDENNRNKELALGPRVRTAKVALSVGNHTVSLGGETRPFNQATLYAKVSGYLKEIRVDKGDKVKKGQILAVIESPETDQAFQAALAAAKNKRDIAKRLKELFSEAVISEQEAEQGITDSDVAEARLRSEEVLKGYETIRAPFDGTVTARFADPGALVQNATNSQAAALPVVTLSEITKLRVDVFVDQRDAAYIKKDENIEVTMNDRPEIKISGTVSRLSDQLDPQTKMLLVEIDISNEDLAVVAGSFVQVKLPIDSPSYLQAPVEALLLKDNKSFLTEVTDQNLMTYKPVEVIANDGKMVSIRSGAKEGEIVALNVADTIPEGGKVRPLDAAGKDLTPPAAH